MVKIGILGGGMVGLSAAAALKDTYRDSDIVVISPDRDDQLASYGAPGGFRPDPSWMPGFACCATSKDGCSINCPLVRWCHKSKEHFWALAASQDAVNAGIFFQPMLDLYSEMLCRIPFAVKLCGSSKLLEMDEIQSLGFSSSIKWGYSFITCMIEGRYHMPYLREKLEHTSPLPVMFELESSCRKDSLDEVRKWANDNHIDVVVNCTGLGSATLCNDDLLIPVRGRLVRVAAPWLKFGIYSPNKAHAYIGRDSVIIGGYREPLPSPLIQPIRPEQAENSREATLNILERMGELWSGPLPSSRIVEEWTGFRPHRDILRLELAWLCDQNGGRSIPIIHNYGHGSMGISLSWGTALDVVYLVTQALKASTGSCTQGLLAPGLEKLKLQ
ncbi:FAD dependent oxidoreductase [Opisthorchis viverrini]|uniref:FAD dependent oxidoreductase n=1 Tax=Opisthorchis viverrini TaxID=6198 RepID=A0A1S8WKQ4_OPIVI|nr:FAD dependent oxidoreductase [Opisthorchis viverrini]